MEEKKSSFLELIRLRDKVTNELNLYRRKTQVKIQDLEKSKKEIAEMTDKVCPHITYMRYASDNPCGFSNEEYDGFCIICGKEISGSIYRMNDVLYKWGEYGGRKSIDIPYDEVRRIFFNIYKYLIKKGKEEKNALELAKVIFLLNYSKNYDLKSSNLSEYVKRDLDSVMGSVKKYILTKESK